MTNFIDLTDTLLLHIDYSEGVDYAFIDGDVPPEDQGHYPTKADGLTPISEAVRCLDQYGNIIECTTDMDGESINVELIERRNKMPKQINAAPNTTAKPSPCFLNDAKLIVGAPLVRILD